MRKNELESLDRTSFLLYPCLESSLIYGGTDFREGSLRSESSAVDQPEWDRNSRVSLQRAGSTNR